MTEDEIRTFALNRFAPPGAPLIAPSPTATLTAERAAMATSTACVTLCHAARVAGRGNADARHAGRRTPGLASPIAATPAATPLDIVPTAPAATPNPAEARATAEAGFAQFADDGLPLAHLSQEDYQRLVAAPALARQKVGDALAATVGQSAPQAAAHILPYARAAEAARVRVTDGGEDFATVARSFRPTSHRRKWWRPRLVHP